MKPREKDEITGVEIIEHEWDGIKELDNPMPRWWLWAFYASVIWAIGYTIAFPAWPLINQATPGVLGYSSRAQLAEEMVQARAGRAEMIAAVETRALADIRSDPAVFSFAMSGGRAAFLVNCSQCHGLGAAGSPGYPNLNDDDWLWGGRLDDIYLTLKHGIRYERDENTRWSQMPAFGRDGVLDEGQIRQVANYVMTLSGQPNDAAAAAQGATIFAENCTACHGATGGGDKAQGAPNIGDPIWLYKSGLEAVMAQVRSPAHGVMPAWGGRLDDATLKQLTIYVHALGGGR